MLPIHHINLRKRASKTLDPYPHPERLKNLIDKAVYAAALLTPVVTIPQAYQIFAVKSSAGVSVVSWICFASANIVWTIYGVVHKEKPIIISNIANFFINIVVIVAALMY